MSPFYFRLLVSAMSVFVVALMVLDQRRLGRMTPGKWALVPFLLAVTVGGAWV